MCLVQLTLAFVALVTLGNGLPYNQEMTSPQMQLPKVEKEVPQGMDLSKFAQFVPQSTKGQRTQNLAMPKKTGEFQDYDPESVDYIMKEETIKVAKEVSKEKKQDYVDLNKYAQFVPKSTHQKGESIQTHEPLSILSSDNTPELLDYVMEPEEIDKKPEYADLNKYAQFVPKSTHQKGESIQTHEPLSILSSDNTPESLDYVMEPEEIDKKPEYADLNKYAQFVPKSTHQKGESIQTHEPLSILSSDNTPESLDYVMEPEEIDKKPEYADLNKYAQFVPKSTHQEGGSIQEHGALAQNITNTFASNDNIPESLDYVMEPEQDYAPENQDLSNLNAQSNQHGTYAGRPPKVEIPFSENQPKALDYPIEEPEQDYKPDYVDLSQFKKFIPAKSSPIKEEFSNYDNIPEELDYAMESSSSSETYESDFGKSINRAGKRHKYSDEFYSDELNSDCEDSSYEYSYENCYDSYKDDF